VKFRAGRYMNHQDHKAEVVAAALGALLIASVANAQAQHDPRLADAAMKRDTAAVRALVEQKVDVNAPGRDGTPALHWIVRVDDLESTRLLIRAGADARLADRYGVTPLALACANGNADVIRVLLDAGADPNSVDPAGETALMMAARIGNLDAVTVLLDRGAVLDARDREFEQTALMVAVRENHPEVVRTFVERHADVPRRGCCPTRCRASATGSASSAADCRSAGRAT
jgi:ankyrin repeat protein